MPLDELEQKIVNLQNQIDNLEAKINKDNFSNTILLNKELVAGNYNSGSDGVKIKPDGVVEMNEDVKIGDVAGEQGIFYDKSAGILEAGGEAIATIISNSKIWYDKFVFLGSYGDGLTETPGAGTITRGLVITTMVSDGNLCSLISSNPGSHQNFECLITAKLLAITAQDIFLGVGDQYNPADTILTDHHAAFIIENGTLYASVADGTTQTLSSVITGITLTNYNKYKIIHTAGTDTKFYINDVLKATLTTNLPSSTSSVIAMSINGSAKTIYIINNYTFLRNITDL